MNRFLITNGLCAVGSHLVELLLKHDPTCHVHLLAYADREQAELFHSWPQDRVACHKPDAPYDDYDTLRSTFERVKPTHVVDLARYTEIPDRFSLGPMTTGVDDLIALLECVRSSPQVRRVLVGSSGFVYGECSEAPVSERATPSARGQHAAACVAAEAYVDAYRAALGLPLITARLFSTYGPRVDDSPINCMVLAAIHGTGIDIYGNGNIERDYLHVADAAAALHLLLTSDAKLDNHVYNVGSGIAVPTYALLDYVSRFVGKPLNYRLRPELPAGEVLRSVAGVYRLRQLGWKPEIPLDVGLKAYAAHKLGVQTAAASATI